MTSSIVRTNPTAGTATTASVRDNFGFAADEITALQRANVDIASTTGGPVAYSASYAGSPTFSYSDGVRVIARINTTNTTTAPTLTISPVATAVPIKKADGSDVSIGDLVANGTYEFVYNASSAEFNCLNLPGNTVTITGDQTITGSKIFSANTDFSAGIDVTGTITCGKIENNLTSGAFEIENTHAGSVRVTSSAGEPRLVLTDAQAQLWFGNSASDTGGFKLVTTSTGVDVTGSVKATGYIEPDTGYKSADGTIGFTGNASASATLTIKNGLIVAVS
jgi:hypothetical protein